jgi:hypothetical protein
VFFFYDVNLSFFCLKEFFFIIKFMLFKRTLERSLPFLIYVCCYMLNILLYYFKKLNNIKLYIYY